MKIHSSGQTPHGLGATVHDTWITANVKSSLALGQGTRGRDIHVKTHGGEVFLSGRVASHRQRNEAIQLTRAVHGVIRVDASKLEVSPSDGLPEAPNAEETAGYEEIERKPHKRH